MICSIELFTIIFVGYCHPGKKEVPNKVDLSDKDFSPWIMSCMSKITLVMVKYM